MKFLRPFILTIAVAFVSAGCALFDSAPEVPANFARRVAFQLGDAPEVLAIPIRDGGDALEIGPPRIVAAPFRGISADGKFHRLLLLTPTGTLYCVVPGGSGSSRLPGSVSFFRTELTPALKARLLGQFSEAEFETDSSASVWLVPGAEMTDASRKALRSGDESAWKQAAGFLEKIKPGDSAEAGIFQFYDRSAGMHGVFCPAESSHVKPDYPPNSVLTLEYAEGRPVRIGGDGEFSDPNELDAALTVHLASGRYGLLKLKLSRYRDIFPLDYSGTGELLRERAAFYGSDFVIEMPDRSAIWFCSRCFSPE